MKKVLLLILGLMLVGTPARAAVIVLDFEGLKDLEQVLDFYNGGTGSLGSAGPDYGIGFGSDSLAIIDSDAGGSGNFANEPSAETILFFLTGSANVMNVAAGFDTGFSFFFSGNSAFGDGTVSVYDGLNGTGALLTTLILETDLTPLDGCGGGDPSGQFSCWAPVGVAFAGIAKSALFAGAANFIGFDDITLGSATPDPDPVPEPASLTLLAIGLVGFLGARRKRAIRA